MKENDFLSIQESKIFSGCNIDLLRSVTESEDFEIVCYSSGDSICEPHTAQRKIGIVLSGVAHVLSADNDRHVLIRTFAKGDIFGVSGVFSKSSDFVSRIVAKNACRVAFFSAAGLSRLLENDRAVLYNYIDFLSDRIRFLNKKIRFFTSGSAERRLALYLDSFGENTFELEAGMSAIADMLDIGRASLYRAFDKLTEDGFIKREKDTVTINDREKMISYYSEK